MERGVHLERSGPVARLTLSHPGRLNALTVAMWGELQAHCTELSADPSLRCVVIRGAEANFAAGADISEFPVERGTEANVRRYHEVVVAGALRAVRDCVHPVVAAIEGVCVGGGLEIALCCDLRLAVAGSRLGAPIAKLGFPMAPDELEGLIDAAGPVVSAELLLEGRILSAEEAYVRGLLTRVVATGELDREVEATIARILANAPQATRWNKRLLRRLAPGCRPFGEEERVEFFRYAETPEHREGIAAFLRR